MKKIKIRPSTKKPVTPAERELRRSKRALERSQLHNENKNMVHRLESRVWKLVEEVSNENE